MNPHSKPRPLIFTPRSPWGRLPLKRTAQNHMRASEDRKPDPTAKDMQGLGGQMAPNQLTGSNGQQAQAGGTGSNVWKVPHTELPPPAANQSANASNSNSNFRAPAMKETYRGSTPESTKPGGNFFMGAEGTKARNEPLDASLSVGYNTNKTQPVAPFDQKEATDDFIRKSWGEKPREKK